MMCCFIEVDYYNLMPKEIINQITNVIPLTKKEQAYVMSKFVVQTYQPNELILSKGQLCDFDGYISKGIVRVYTATKEQEQILQFVQEEQWVADYTSFFTNAPTELNVQAIESCEIWMISKSALEQIEEEIPAWKEVKSAFFEYQYLKKEKEYQRRVSTTPEERYLYLQKSKPALLQRVSQYYIAQYIGVKPESLSRIRKRVASKISS